MKILVILGHPKKGSFNHAIAKTAIKTLRKNRHEVLYHDLYQERFDPILSAKELDKDIQLTQTIKQHCKDLSSSDGIIIIHPNWWGQPPAILTGWLDRVMRPNVAYKFAEGDKGEGVPFGLLKAKAALIFNTSNTPASREKNVFKDPLQSIWQRCVFDLCGIKKVYRKMFSVIVTSTLEERKRWLNDVAATINKCFPPSV